MNIFKPLAVAAMSIAVTMATSSANAEGYLACNKPVTLTGTVLICKFEYDKRNYPTPPHSVSIPFLVADQAICMRPSEDEELISAKRIVRLDGRLPPCSRE